VTTDELGLNKGELLEPKVALTFIAAVSWRVLVTQII
jgi:hypothetical protein